MRVLAIDPGVSRSGIAIVELDQQGWLHIIFGAHAENAGSEIENWITVACADGWAIAIEEVVGEVYKGRTGAHLMEACKAEGAFVASAMRNGCKHLVRLPARTWRAELCRSKGASDGQVQIAVEGICKTIPPLTSATREHVYDAAGMGAVALAMVAGRTLRLPPKVEAAIHMQREAEKTKRAAKGKEPKERRSLSRRQRERKSEAGKRAWAARR